MARIARVVGPGIPHHLTQRGNRRLEAIKHDLPAPTASISDAYREVWRAPGRQLRHEDWFIRRELPATANACRAELNDEAAAQMAVAE